MVEQQYIHTLFYIIEIDGDNGYFMHVMLGDECQGTLHFEGPVLTGYSGVNYLPDEIVNALMLKGYKDGRN
jgi:hypothetical protein